MTRIELNSLAIVLIGFSTVGLWIYVWLGLR